VNRVRLSIPLAPFDKLRAFSSFDNLRAFSPIEAGDLHVIHHVITNLAQKQK